MGRRGLGESELVEDDREGSTPDRLQELAPGGNEEAAHELRADDSTASTWPPLRHAGGCYFLAVTPAKAGVQGRAARTSPRGPGFRLSPE